MKHRLLLILIAMLPVASMNAQTLEEVNFSAPGGQVNFNSYLTDINDNGFLTGYFDNTVISQTIGIIITPKGRKLWVQVPGNNVVKVEAISENNVALVTASNGTTTTTYKYYMNMATDTIGLVVPVTNFQQPNAVPTGINNKTDITGWYMGTTNRWLFQSNDSIPLPSGSSAWNASRYMQGIVYYNTQASATNDIGNTCGFYFSGNVIAPFVYTASNNTYTILNTSFKMRLYDINNSNMVVGEYQQANGFYTSFWGQVLGTGIIQVHSMNSLFAPTTPPIQSVANGINDKGEVVGSYVHPVTGMWVGFVYRPNQSNYRLPGFNFNQHTSSMHNTKSMPNDIWSSNYYSGFHYTTADPYVPAAGPLLDPVIIARYQSGKSFKNVNNFPDSAFVSWNAFASEKELYNGSVPKYWIRKHLEFTKFLMHSSPKYAGACYGFAYASLLRALKDPVFLSVFNVAAGSNFYSYTNAGNPNVTLGIERMFLKQFDNYIYDKYNPTLYQKVGMWDGLYRLKLEFMKPASTSNPTCLGLTYTDNSHHSVTPYKIYTPQLFPFNYPSQQYDTVYIYDSNHPGDSTRTILIKSSLVNMPGDSAIIQGPGFKRVNFNEASINEIVATPSAAFKTTAVNDDFTSFTLSLDRNVYYTITDQNSSQAKADQNGFSNGSSLVVPVEQQDTKSNMPIAFTLDTLQTITVASHQYDDSGMLWSMYNNLWSMGLNRQALPAEKDHSTFGDKLMTYGNPDNVAKSLTGFFNQVDLGLTKGVSIIASNIAVQPGDSLVTESPSQFMYSIKRIGGAPTTYGLLVHSVLNDTLKAFTTGNIPIQGQTTHIIDPYFNDGGVIKTVIKVDNGNNGSFEDTIFIAQVPLDIDEIAQNVSYVKTYPNPVTKMLHVSISNPGSYTLFLSDIHGRKVDSRLFSMAKGNIVEISMSGLASGTYLLHVIDQQGNMVYRDKILKQ